MPARHVWALPILGLLLGYAAPSYGSDIDLAMRTQDIRLQRPVTIHAAHIYLGDLLEQLSKQTGITVAVDENDTASGTELTVQCSGVPVGDLLNALWSLLSSRDMAWEWSRNSFQNTYAYQLTEPAEAKARTDHMRALCQQAFENFVTTMLKFSFILRPTARQTSTGSRRRCIKTTTHS